jgi:putative toxin-antitoxin system antitoxin component (TIGR02293 family)
MEIAISPVLSDPDLKPLALFGLQTRNAEEGIRLLKRGLPAQGWTVLVNSLGANEKDLAEVVQISTTTLARRKKAGRFTLEESERLLRIARLVAQAQRVFRSQQGLARWFNQPNRGLGGATPLEYASTPIGAEEVERVLERILDGSPA